MNNKNLSEALNYIDDNIIQTTEAARIVNKKYVLFCTIRTCVAACLVIAIGIGSTILIPKLKPKEQKPQTNITDFSNLQTLTISQNVGNGGFEAYMAHDISELVNANPWYDGCEITTLPVYKNTLNLDENAQITNIDNDKMNSFILDIAQRCGLKKNEIEVIRDSRAYTDSLFVKTDSFKIRVDPELTATIEFEPKVSLPDKYNFSYYNSTYDDMVEVAKYFKNEYKEIINFKDPKINITKGDYNIYNQQSYSIEFYDGSSELTNDIINYNFNRVTFHCDDVENKLWMIYVYNPDLSEKIGDYPIITVDEADKLLKNGNYITNVPSNYEVNTSNVAKVELIYRNTYWLDNTYIPYYRFYIEIPELENRYGHGLKHYGAYYVPAVDSKFISNMPLYDGNFN